MPPMAALTGVYWGPVSPVFFLHAISTTVRPESGPAGVACRAMAGPCVDACYVRNGVWPLRFGFAAAPQRKEQVQMSAELPISGDSRVRPHSALVLYRREATAVDSQCCQRLPSAATRCQRELGSRQGLGPCMMRR